MRSLIALLISSTCVCAQDQMTGAEFDAYVTGRTLSFGTQGNPDYGVEQYLPNRDVIWSPAPGICVAGVWYEQDGDICFVYDDTPEPKCWQVFQTETGIRAEFSNRPDTSVIFESQDNPQPLVCPSEELLG